jgi:hypothetical protein
LDFPRLQECHEGVHFRRREISGIRRHVHRAVGDSQNHLIFRQPVIELADAVSDLIDNSVDAARRHKTNGDYNGLEARKVIAGIEESKPTEAGWYVSCNGRFVLVADQSQKTGWGEDGGKLIPKMHHQFARFRGYVFFECQVSCVVGRTGPEGGGRVVLAAKGGGATRGTGISAE